MKGPFLEGRSLAGTGSVETSVCIVGSGAGGAMLAHELAREGIDVVVLEAGPDLPPRDMTQREDEMLAALYRSGGALGTDDRAVSLLAGRGLGGSTLHNLCLCKRAPAEVLQSWQRFGVAADAMDLARHYDYVERTLGVHRIPDGMQNPNNLLFRRGVEALGYRGGPLSHNRTDCIGAGFCALGCSFDRKQNARKVLLPAAAEAGARIYTGCRVERVILDAAGRARGVEATAMARDGSTLGPVRVAAHVVCLSAGAIGSTVIALRSSIPDPYRWIGRGLRIHPGTFAVGLVDELVEAWRGIPQSFDCTELLDFSAGSKARVWLVPGSAHPISAAVMMPGVGPDHVRWMAALPNLAASIAMVHDETEGTIGIGGDGRPVIGYWPGPGDRRQLVSGLAALARIYFAAGARAVLLPFEPPLVLERPEQVRDVEGATVQPHRLPVMGVHLQGGMRMGGTAAEGVTAATGAVHTVPGLFVADGSLFPTSLGVPPQMTIYANARRVAERVAEVVGA